MNDTEYDFGVIAATVGSYMSFSTGGGADAYGKGL